jgi:hypothetical protein
MRRISLPLGVEPCACDMDPVTGKQPPGTPRYVWARSENERDASHFATARDAWRWYRRIAALPLTLVERRHLHRAARGGVGLKIGFVALVGNEVVAGRTLVNKGLFRACGIEFPRRHIFRMTDEGWAWLSSSGAGAHQGEP